MLVLNSKVCIKIQSSYESLKEAATTLTPPLINKHKQTGTDVRIDLQNRDMFTEMKESGELPFGQVPLLEVCIPRHRFRSSLLRLPFRALSLPLSQHFFFIFPALSLPLPHHFIASSSSLSHFSPLLSLPLQLTPSSLAPPLLLSSST